MALLLNHKNNSSDIVFEYIGGPRLEEARRKSEENVDSLIR